MHLWRARTPERRGARDGAALPQRCVGMMMMEGRRGSAGSRKTLAMRISRVRGHAGSVRARRQAQRQTHGRHAALERPLGVQLSVEPPPLPRPEHHAWERQRAWVGINDEPGAQPLVDATAPLIQRYCQTPSESEENSYLSAASPPPGPTPSIFTPFQPLSQLLYSLRAWPLQRYPAESSTRAPLPTTIHHD